MSRSRIFRTNWRGRGRKWRLIADALNLIGQVLNNVTIDGRDAELTLQGLALTSSGTGGGGGFDAVIQAGRRVDKIWWDYGMGAPGETFPVQASAPTDYLFVPFDDNYQPYYTTEVAYMRSGTGAAAGGLSSDAVDYAQESEDVRKNGEFYKISETAGVQHLPRA